MKFALVRMDKFLTIVLTSLMTKITCSFSCLKSLKRDEKETPTALFHGIIP